jgi:hypothetical protein
VCLAITFACENLFECLLDKMDTTSGRQLDVFLQTVLQQYRQELACKTVICKALETAVHRASCSVEDCMQQTDAGSVSQSECTVLLAVWALPPFVRPGDVHKALSLAYEVFDIPLLSFS